MVHNPLMHRHHVGAGRPKSQALGETYRDYSEKKHPVTHGGQDVSTTYTQYA